MYRLFKNVLFALSPETAHTLVKKLSKLAPLDTLRTSTAVKSKYLKAAIGQTPLTNPIGLAAGFDKNGDMIPFLSALGFGFLELGSITALPCAGNPKPRIFRLTQDKSLINRMGLPNIGADAFARRMTHQKTAIPYGVNIAKTPDFAQTTKTSGIDDFLASYERLYFLGNYTVFNLSCPNTGETKTFEDPGLFAELAQAIQSKRREFGGSKPILMKLSPDLDGPTPTKIVEQTLKGGFDGFVVTNTTKQRMGLQTPAAKVAKIANGGLSGRALAGLADRQLARVFEITGKDEILMGVGGIMSFGELIAKLASGASLFQVYTGFIYEGPFFVKRLNEQLHAFCEKMGVKNYRELVGNKELSRF